MFRLYTLPVFIIITIAGLTFNCHPFDPTGTYDYFGETTEKEGDLYGYTGQIQVKKLSANKIAVTFEVNRGAPSYHSGFFVDTLSFKKNRAVYYAPLHIDPSCEIVFDFNAYGAHVKEYARDYNYGCGFGHAIVVDNIFKKISDETPELRHPLTGEVLP